MWIAFWLTPKPLDFWRTFCGRADHVMVARANDANGRPSDLAPSDFHLIVTRLQS